MSLFDRLVDQALVQHGDLASLRVVVEKELLHHDIMLALSEAGRALQTQVLPLKAQLLCQFGDQDLLEVEGLRRSLDRLLSRLSG